MRGGKINGCFSETEKKRTTRRLIEGTVTALSLTALIVFSILKEKSKVVTPIGITPFFSYDSVRYTCDFSLGILIAAVIFAFSASLLPADFLCARIYHTKIDEEDVIVVQGMGPARLLVNGEEKDVMVFKGYLETKLKSGVTVNVSPQFFMSYHLTFSDGRPAIDL